MISASQVGVMVDGTLVDLLSEYYGITETLIRSTSEVVLAVTEKVSPKITALLVNGGVSATALSLSLNELDRITIKEVEK